MDKGNFTSNGKLLAKLFIKIKIIRTHFTHRSLFTLKPLAFYIWGLVNPGLFSQLFSISFTQNHNFYLFIYISHYIFSPLSHYILSPLSLSTFLYLSLFLSLFLTLSLTHTLSSRTNLHALSVLSWGKGYQIFVHLTLTLQLGIDLTFLQIFPFSIIYHYQSRLILILRSVEKKKSKFVVLGKKKVVFCSNTV